MEKQLTEKQQKFIEALFGEAKGSPKKAAEIAGYSNALQGYNIVKVIRKEIIEAAENILALNAPRAAHLVVDILNGKDVLFDHKNRMDAAKQILDRVGVNKNERGNITVEGDNAIILFPAKNPN